MIFRIALLLVFLDNLVYSDSDSTYHQIEIQTKSSLILVKILIDKSGRIDDVLINGSADPYNAKLSSKRWLKSLHNKSANELLNVDCVSGATLSCNNVKSALASFLRSYK
ncbi:MAG: FMN-binding protein [Fibrobacteres bacterium]|nr:FMN-binding protein [Fibrobacterota bacterium]